MNMMVVLLLLVVVVVNSADVRKLKTTPTGINVADWNEYMGRWYMYANIQPCSWIGGQKFTDWAMLYVMNTDKYPEFTIIEEWRKGSCSKTNNTCAPTSPGCYTVSDTLGDLWSGKAVIVDGDKRFRNYAIRWGCTKYLGEECADYWWNVATRIPNPGQNIIDKINRKLAELWDTSLFEMVVVQHNDPCEPAPTLPDPAPRQKWKKY